MVSIGLVFYWVSHGLGMYCATFVIRIIFVICISFICRNIVIIGIRFLICISFQGFIFGEISCYNLGKKTESWKKSVNRPIFGIPTTLAALIISSNHSNQRESPHAQHSCIIAIHTSHIYSPPISTTLSQHLHSNHTIKSLTDNPHICTYFTFHPKIPMMHTITLCLMCALSTESHSAHVIHTFTILSS